MEWSWWCFNFFPVSLYLTFSVDCSHHKTSLRILLLKIFVTLILCSQLISLLLLILDFTVRYHLGMMLAHQWLQPSKGSSFFFFYFNDGSCLTFMNRFRARVVCSLEECIWETTTTTCCTCYPNSFSSEELVDLLFSFLSFLFLWDNKRVSSLPLFSYSWLPLNIYCKTCILFLSFFSYISLFLQSNIVLLKKTGFNYNNKNRRRSTECFL